MKEIGLEELRSIQMDILKDVHKFCVANDIKYFLSNGTLIGAIRHNGYIPWDDDVDICMPRPDYQRFMLSYNSNGSQFRFICMENNSKYSLPAGKVCHSRTEMRETMYAKDVFGVYIDVFPLDGCDSEGKNIVRSMRLRKLLNAKKAVIGSQRTFAKNCLILAGKIVLAFISTRCILNGFKRLCDRNSYEESEYVAYLAGHINGKMEMFPKEWVLNSVSHLFEGFNFKVPEKYDEILRCKYGDYMTLPPVEERVSTHVFTAYWKEY